MKKLNIIIFTVFVGLFCSGQTQKPLVIQTGFRPAQIWSDTNGNTINAHGGGVIFFKGIYYWYGEHKAEHLEAQENMQSKNQRTIFEPQPLLMCIYLHSATFKSA